MSGLSPIDVLREVVNGAQSRDARLALAAVERLVAAADELRLWEPGRKGYAAAQDRLFAALWPFVDGGS